MKKINFANFVSLRNNWLKRHLMLSLIVLSVLSGMNAQQVIGSFPYMNGGFEGQAAGALATTTNTNVVLSPTNWTQVQTAGISSSIATTSPRTGLNYATTTVVAGSVTTSNNKVLQGPQLQPFNAAASPTASTPYVFQYWVRNAATVPSFAVSVNTNGVANNGYVTTATFPIHSDWTKVVTPVTTNAAAITSSGVLVLKSLVGTFDVDDIVIYAGTTEDVTAPDPVTSPSAPTASPTQMTVSWTIPALGVDGGGYMVVRGSSDPTTTPNANGIYAVGNFVAGTEKVMYLGTNNSYTDLSLSPSTTYYYRIYTVDKAFNYSSAVSISGTTASPSFDAEPTSQASSISFANVSSTGFDINWTKGNGTNSLVVIHSGSAVNADPVDGSTYTANTAMGSGSQIGTGNYVVYTGTGSTVTVTGLTKYTTYYVNVYSFNGTGGSENFLTTSPATGSQLTLRGEISSTGNNTAGSSWASAASWNGNVVPGQNDNVTIAAGDKIYVASSQSCYNLTIPATAKVYNTTALPATPLYLTVYGTSLICNGTLGDKITDGSADGALGINFNNNLTISGSGLLRPARIRPNSGASNLTLTIDADMQILYNGTTGTGGAGMYTDNGGDNITIIVNAGKTLTFASGSNFNSNALSATNGAANTTITIDGTVNVNSNANFSMPIASGKTYSLTVNGALNVGNFNATSSTGGAIPTVSVGPAGSITVSGTADFSITSLSAYVGGTGTFTLNSGGTINIAAANGLESTAGPIRTTTRNFNSAANYTYLGAVAQLTGSDMPATVNTLTITNPAGVTLSSNTTATTLTNSTSSILNVPAAKQLTVSTTLTNNGILNLLSDNTNGTATLLTPATIAGTGTANVKQYITTGRNWYVSSPVSDATSSVFTPESGNTLLWYDEVHGTSAPWVYITNNSTSLNVMQGYVANMTSSGVVTFSGSLNTGAKSIDVSRTTGQTKEGFNLVGNPYPSYLDWDNVTKNNLLTTLWYRTKTTPAPVTGATTWIFDTYNSTGKLGTSLGAKTVTNLIPPMQAFWVRVNEGQTSGTFSVTNDQRAHADNSSNGFKSRLSTASTQSVLRLEVSNGLTRDQALVYFNANASNSYDSYDSPKMSNETVSIPEIYTLAGSEQVVINGVNNLTQLTLGFSTGEANQFTIKASQFTNFVSGTQIVLRDNLLNYEQDLTLGDYNFYSDITANNESRFTVLFKAPSVATGINQNSSANGWISQNANNQIVVNGASAESIVAVYNEIGQRLMSQRLTSTTKALGAFVPGVYMVTVTNAGKNTTTKVIIK